LFTPEPPRSTFSPESQKSCLFAFIPSVCFHPDPSNSIPQKFLPRLDNGFFDTSIKKFGKSIYTLGAGIQWIHTYIGVWYDTKNGVVLLWLNVGSPNDSSPKDHSPKDHSPKDHSPKDHSPNVIFP
jgi:hypothetical protein